MKFLFVVFIAAISSLSLTDNAQSHHNTYEIEVTHKSAAPYPGKQIPTATLTALAAKHPHDVVLLFTPQSIHDTIKI
jgi:hypothetical protein